MDWGDILYNSEHQNTVFRQANGVFYHHRKCRRIVDYDSVVLCISKKYRRGRHADAFGRAFKAYSGQSDNKIWSTD